ncbi:Orf y [Tanacetum coccineum]
MTATIALALVKQLCEETGAGMMDCKKALAETEGDLVKAHEYLRKKGLASADKKASRATAEGRIRSYIHDSRIGVLVEVNCETDFVSRGDIFKELVNDFSMQVAACPQVEVLSPEDVPPQETIEKEKAIEITSAGTRFACLSLDSSSCLSRTSVEDVWPSRIHFFGYFSNCSLKILLGSSETCIFPSVLFTGSLPLIEKLSSLLAKLDIEFSSVILFSDMKWDNPFAAKRAQIINKHEEHAFPIATDAESSTSYQPSPDAIIGPTVYPPARQNPQPAYKPDYQFGYPQGRGNTFNGGYDEYHNSQWTLPPAWTKSGIMLVLPADPGLWSDVISRWESITINRLNSQTWSDNKAKLAFLAVKLGKLYFPSTTEKLFAKLPPSLSKKIEESFKAKHPGLSAGVLPAIKFTHTFVLEMFKDAALANELRDLSICSAIPIPGYYKNNRKKYEIRKNDTLQKRLHKKVSKEILKDPAVYQELDHDDHWKLSPPGFDNSSV